MDPRTMSSGSGSGSLSLWNGRFRERELEGAEGLTLFSLKGILKATDFVGP